MSVDKADLVEVEKFLDLIKSMNISRRKICLLVASDECTDDENEINTISEKFRKRLSRKSISKFELTLMQDILAKQTEYTKSNQVNISREKKLFKDADFERSLSSIFREFHTK
ncbi:hypothetical protein OA92_08655 [Marinomonas sp. SBI22]|uniref:hypothetical protein n=1 Tax=unclassified Marinomonas TaxID=196814 RepID=UPI0007AF40A5|nr:MULTISPECIES: hypothetical protein [unclassified Marinomonas]KZM43734.1 hypothetical protein OA92_08655 [Marinomonas sp. SBI22]KZM47296.1 hypothetical protein OA91_02035 [Marinomonas sp. SBI8L]